MNHVKVLLTVNTLLIKGAPGASNSSHVTFLLRTVESLKDVVYRLSKAVKKIPNTKAFMTF